MRTLGVVVLTALVAFGCVREGPDEGHERGSLRPTRGYVLISLDALRADALGVYGAGPQASPFLDSLAARGALFERSIVHYPSTLVSHLSLLTGLLPQQHGVYPPSGVLSREIPTLAERFQTAGYRTAAHTEGGFMAGGYGFARGFDEFTDTAHAAERDVERTFGRGIEFLRSLGESETFFLFLHTYSIHDPYDPPGEYRPDVGDAESGMVPDGPTLRAFNRGSLQLSAGDVDGFRALYAGSVRYTDAVVEKLWQEIERLGLAADTTLVVTSDHGEEFLEHGKLGHTQIYPESLFVPLLVVHPDQNLPVRVPGLVGQTDVAPTLLELAGLAPFELSAGRSLVEELLGRHGEERESYAEVIDLVHSRSLLLEEGGRLYQLVVSQATADPGGVWVTRSVTFDNLEPVLELEAQSFHEPRTVRVEADGRAVVELRLGTTWSAHEVEFPGEAAAHRVTLSTENCASPVSLGAGDDSRCLSFQVRGLQLRRIELYNLTDDPLAETDRVRDLPELRDRMVDRLRGFRFEPVAPPEQLEVAEELRETLRALGYVD